ncbi:glycine zipper 2TM domain-containing protein [Fusobacterium nucleatum subsp. nucleatum ATCC 25586]|uniref:Glycine zipper 2TM domain-containing protein n=1 Tax=Fusobacterium nucleatum subsp. nucleatum (strain ATCC 25586 / DSM 15643 / BCRC 10681 / CIP 101130 / JCM 8532 / KCTC 2640 / LMG 13131 / VPI 4355) TaxID=190304 RepID=Q8RH00_FUSNN|nr:unknown [Fusobacterium nucleatum subsp. nucleatum ATCC 25586]ASG27232.1 hypothetical protein RN84_01275 [Fusobacterium nucleatum subsp. nucleatum]AVQ15803.1 glycine zipper 2TM domain-containing protein [Fusobacterium nucleatum subsp. nucleatum ATCC 25586]
MLSLGFTSTTYARERNGSSGRDRDRDYGSRGYRSRRDNSGGWGGPKLNYDGKTSGLGRELGGIVGGAAGGTIGGKFGGSKGGLAGGYIGGKIGSRAGDSWERRTNRSAHDKWNNKGSKGNGSWRFSDEID